MMTRMFSVVVTKLVKQDVQIADMNGAKFYDPSKTAGKRDEEAILPLTLTGISPSSYSICTNDKKKRKSEKRKEVWNSSNSSHKE